MIEGLHPVVLAFGDDLAKPARLLGVDDHVTSAAGHPQDLAHCNSTVAGRRLDQALGDDRLQRAAEHRPGLLVLMGREEVDDPVHGLGCVEGVDGGEDEVAGLGRRQGGLHGFLVAHLADEDHVRVLSQDTTEGATEGGGVHSDLALIDDRITVRVQVLDRILDCHDVAGLRLVDLVDHGGERRRLSGAGGAGEEDQTALLVGDLAHHRGQAEVVDRADGEGNYASRDRDRSALHERVDAEAREALHGVGEVDLVLTVELGQLVVVGEHLAQHPVGVDRAHRLVLLDRLELAVDSR